MSDENIHKGHRKRMREKVRKNGLDSLQEHEILEYILYYSIPRINTNEIAHKLIKKCNGFANVFKAPDEVLRSVDKVGENTISHLHMLDEFARYYTKAMSGAHRLKLNGKNCEEYLMNLFNGETRELFYMICLDAKSRIIYHEMICEGGFESVDINPSKIVRVAVWHDAPYVLFAHNHPGGIAKPSNTDLVTTHAIERVLRVIGVEVLDHIIVADREYYSMSNEGKLLKQQRYYIENSDNDDLWG